MEEGGSFTDRFLRSVVADYDDVDRANEHAASVDRRWDDWGSLSVQAAADDDEPLLRPFSLGAGAGLPPSVHEASRAYGNDSIDEGDDGGGGGLGAPDALVEAPFGGADVRGLSRSRRGEPVVRAARAMGAEFDLAVYEEADYAAADRGRADPKPGNISRFATHSASAGIIAAIFSLFNDILSSGVVAMPMYVAQTGVVVFGVVTLFMGWLTVRTVDDLYFLSRKYQKFSYAELCEHSLGKPGYLVVIFFMFVFNGGGLVANLQLLGLTLIDIVHGFTDADFFLIDRRWVIVIAVALFSPFTFFRNVTHFKFNSILSLLCLVSVVLIVLVMAFVEGNALPFDPWYNILIPPLSIDIMGGIAGISFLFVCHDMSFSVYDEIHNPTRRRSSLVIQITMVFTVLCFSAIAYGGYFTFYGNVQANIVSNYSFRSIPAMAARFLIVIAISASVPYMCFMPRLSLYALLSMMCGKFLSRHKLFFHIFATVFVLFLSLLLAVIFDNLGATYELVGAVSAVGLAWILPPLIYLRLERQRWFSFVTIQKVLILSFGVFSMVGGVLSVILQVLGKD